MKIQKFLAVIILSVSVHAEAGLISSIDADTEKYLSVSWVWDGEYGVRDSVAPSNWDGFIDLEISDPAVHDVWFFGYFFYAHSASPFTYVLGPVLIPGMQDSTGILIDSSFHSIDVKYHFFFDRAANPTESQIRATATRISIPSPLALSMLSIFWFVWPRASCSRRKNATSGGYAKGCGPSRLSPRHLLAS